MKSSLLLISAFFLYLSCNTVTQEVAQKPAEVNSSASALISPEQSALSREKIIMAYSAAIEKYLEAEYPGDKPFFDTLFIGRHIEFPAIELPSMMSNVHVRLLMPEESEVVSHQKNFAMLNMFGWISENAAEFIIVPFKDGFRPQHRCFINFMYEAKDHRYVLSSLNFEDKLPNGRGETVNEKR